jgi:tetratricopeptide (TPR) repeat protein
MFVYSPYEDKAEHQSSRWGDRTQLRPVRSPAVDVVLGLLVAAVIGVLWVVLLRRTAARRRLIGAPKDVTSVLDAYRKGRWQQVADQAPPLLARPSDGGDKTWRPALELALGHALVETDRPDEAVAHLERGLLLHSALRRTQGGTDVSESADAKFRHLLGWAYAESGRTAQARREYRRVLEIPDLEMPIRLRVEASLSALDDSPA